MIPHLKHTLKIDINLLFFNARGLWSNKNAFDGPEGIIHGCHERWLRFCYHNFGWHSFWDNPPPCRNGRSLYDHFFTAGNRLNLDSLVNGWTLSQLDVPQWFPYDGCTGRLLLSKKKRGPFLSGGRWFRHLAWHFPAHGGVDFAFALQFDFCQPT